MIAAQEIARAVDGIDNPAAAIGSVLGGTLFAEQAVAGKSALHGVDDQTFAFAIGDGHGRAVWFVLGRDAAPQMGQRELTGRVAQFARQLEFFFEGHQGSW